MKTQINTLLATLMMACAFGVQAQQPATGIPTDAAMEKAMRAVQQRATGALDGAQRQAAPGGGGVARIIPDFQNAEGVDPAAIAENFKQGGPKPKDEDAPELIIFASLSRPEASLRKIGEQAKRAGAVVVFRGLKHGFAMGGWNRSMQALKPIADTGAEVQVHPELFTRYNVTAVPTVVVTATPQAGCQDDACAGQSASVLGDVTLDYALETLVDRKDQVGVIARKRIKLLRNS